MTFSLTAIHHFTNLSTKLLTLQNNCLSYEEIYDLCSHKKFNVNEIYMMIIESKQWYITLSCPGPTTWRTYIWMYMENLSSMLFSYIGWSC